MSGIEKILRKIEAETDESCNALLTQAKERAERILAEAAEEGQKIRTDILNKAQIKQALELGVAQTGALREQRMTLLQAKASLANEIIDEALARLHGLEDREYFEVIEGLVKAYARKGKGNLRFNPHDLNRLPTGFEAKLNQALAPDQEVAISQVPSAIDGGFVIEYEGIDQNCSFASMVEADLESIKDDLNTILFPGEAS